MNIPLPTNFNVKDSKGNKAIIEIDPCYPGYGVTLGNSLRRVLLSSIEGAAITSFKVEGASHEFSSLDGVKEDVVEIILNIKKIRVKVFSDEPVVLKISQSGEKVVKAGDIEKNSEVEIANPDLELFTLTDKKQKIEMELVAQKGLGYVTVEDRGEEKVDVGYIMVDAFYSPLVSVGFEIENVRVGDRTDYEKLVLKLETDGTITPKEAVEQAAQKLVDHFQFIAGGKIEQAEEEEKKEEGEEKTETVNEETKEEKPKKRGRPKKSDK